MARVVRSQSSSHRPTAKVQKEAAPSNLIWVFIILRLVGRIASAVLHLYITFKAFGVGVLAGIITLATPIVSDLYWGYQWNWLTVVLVILGTLAVGSIGVSVVIAADENL